MHALLFMLVHSPRPIVGSLSYLIIDLSPLSFPLLIIIRRNKSQVYLIHVHKMDPCLLSVDTIKRFALLGFVAPKQVSWTLNNL